MRMLRLLVPNGLTATRFAAAFMYPVLFHLHINPLGCIWQMDYRVGIFVATALAAATDILDGYTARKLGCTTDFGRKFDPLSDALFCFSIAEMIVAYGGFTLYAALFYWAPAICAAAYTYEVSCMRWRKEINGPNWNARVAIACFMVGGSTLLAHIAFDSMWLFEAVGVTALMFGTYFERLSLSEYKKIRRSSIVFSTA